MQNRIIAYFVRTTIGRKKMMMNLKVVKIALIAGEWRKKLPSNIGLFGK